MATFTNQGNIEALAFDPDHETVGARRRITNSTEGAGSPALSPDGQRVVFVRTAVNGTQDLWVVKKDGTGLRQVTNDPAFDRVPRWSADGTRLMFYSDRSGKSQVWTIAADGGGLMQVTDYPGMVTQPVPSPDGTRGMANSSFPDNKLLVFDPRISAGQQKVEEIPTFTDGGFTPTSWSRDGFRVAGRVTGRPGRGIVIYSVASRTFEEVARSGTDPAWLPDGRRLVYAAGTAGRELVLYDTKTKITKQLFSSPSEFFSGVDLAPDGREIYCAIFKPQSDIILAKLK